ncbi:MAG: enoyl-CoA hydratase/isomerase family protein [Myxococcota bacterium]|nr:enoyl-CoA hydratase/isomerase family protein [Myxococcota bacterium]
MALPTPLQMIDLERDGAIHVVTLNDGPNTVYPEWQERMLEVLAAIEADCEGDAGMVLTGHGKFFCSGLNVEVVMGLEGEARGRFSRSMMEIMRRLLLLPVPTVAALNGHAFAAGAFLALACDYRVMRADRGWFCISEVDVGVPIGAPMTNLLKAKVTPQVARNAILSGHRYPADEAVAAGIADAMASEAELVAEAKKLASELASKERGIFGKLKRTLNAEVAAGFEGDG